MSDFSELENLAVDLGRAGALAGVKALKVLEDFGGAVEADAKAFAPGANGGPAKHYPKTITHDVTVEADAIVAEIGPDKELFASANRHGPGALGNILEYGTSELAPQAHLGPAVDRKLPDAVHRLEDIGGEIL